WPMRVRASCSKWCWDAHEIPPGAGRGAGRHLVRAQPSPRGRAEESSAPGRSAPAAGHGALPGLLAASAARRCPARPRRPPLLLRGPSAKGAGVGMQQPAFVTSSIFEAAELTRDTSFARLWHGFMTARVAIALLLLALLSLLTLAPMLNISGCLVGFLC